MRVLLTEGSDEEGWTPRLRTYSHQPYAILSHRWADDPNHEILYADIEELDELRFGQGADEYRTIIQNTQYTGIHPSYKPGFNKVQGAARQALKDGHAYIWIDTCCIDKNSSAELSEAINSMWIWYKLSTICYVYLFDVTVPSFSEFAQSSWWTRGWTLQELLAPQELTFFTAEWNAIGPKKHMDMTISRITNINPNIVNGTIPLRSVCIAQRMSWASTRTTSRIEDMAYCLLGLFGVNMPLLYGEGENAFLRLQQEIIKDSDDETIFAWKDESIAANTLHGLLARGPAAFATSFEATQYRDTDLRSPYTMTNKGLAITMNVAPLKAQTYTAELYCPNPEGSDKYVSIYLEKTSTTNEQYARVRCGEWASPGQEKKTRKTIYVKQRHDQRPAYTNLDLYSAGKTRLFRVLPADNQATVRVEMVEADIEISRYSIVSHVWDRSDDSCTVWVNSEPRQVSNNLFRFLQLTQQSREAKLFWVDYICIQQLDQLEKDYALRIWTRICAYAQECIIWLGDLSKDITPLPTQRNKLFSAVTTSRVERGYGSLERGGQSKEKYTLFSSIARHTYWRRAWVIQEPFLADRISLECIATSSGELIQSRLTLNALEVLRVSALNAIRPYSLESIDTTYMDRMLEFFREKPLSVPNHTMDGLLNRKPEPKIPQLDFENLITRFQYQKATDPRDQVFALIAISSLSSTFSLDYALSVEQIFYRVARALNGRLTLTILPKLVEALGILYMPTERLSSDYGDSENVGFDVQNVVHPLVGERRSDRSRDDVSFQSTDDFLYTLENNFDVKGGLVFGRKLPYTEHNQQGEYRPQCLYIRENPRNRHQYSFVTIPEPFEKALAKTYAFLEKATPSVPQFRLNTDNHGLLALGFCLQKSPGGLPQIFQRFYEQIIGHVAPHRGLSRRT